MSEASLDEAGMDKATMNKAGANEKSMSDTSPSETSENEQRSGSATMSNPTESPRSLVVERIFQHSPEKVWRALTEGSLLAQWMMSNDFEPVVGRKFQFRAEPKPNWSGVVDCEVLIVEPPQRLTYNWGTGGIDSGLQWLVEWTLTPADGGTHVRMEQSGFRPEQRAAYQGAKYGWNNFIGNLERVVGGI